MEKDRLACCVVRDLLPAYLEDLTEPETAELAAARDLARETGAAEALALLLERQRDAAPRGLDKTFDL